MRIGLISQEFPPETAKGGIGTQTYLKAVGLAGLGHDVRVISRSTSQSRSESRYGGLRVVRVPATAMPLYTELADWVCYSQRVAEEIAYQHAREAFDILDFPEWGCEGYVHLLNQSEWNSIPTVVHLHGPLVMLGRTLGWPDPDSQFFRVGTQMEGTCLRLATSVFSSSECSANWCAREYGLDRESIPVIHTGIDTDLFKPGASEEPAELTIIFVGKIVRNKGVEILLEAFFQLSHRFPELRLRLLGRGEKSLMDSLTNKAADRGLGDKLDMAGYVSREDLPAHLCRAHVFAAPSEYEGGPGFVYLEAMACGLPVIGCRGSGAAEVIIDGENGLLVPPNNISALVDALSRLLADGSERKSMSARAKKFVSEYADKRTCVPQIADFYQNVIAEFESVRNVPG